MKKIDKVIIAVVFFFSISAIIALTFSKSYVSNSKVIIQVGSEVVEEIPLNYTNESKNYEFGFSEYKGYIEMKNGKVRMKEMSRQICPEAICSQTGWITSTYQSIVCLPNKIVVTIEGSKNVDVDI